MKAVTIGVALFAIAFGFERGPYSEASADDGSAVSAQDPVVIKIVSSLPRTGSAKAQTDTIVNGIRMAFEQADWKVDQFAIKYEDLDDSPTSWHSKEELRNANQAVKDKDVMVYIGTFNSGAAKISMPILNEAHLLMISPVNTWPGLTKPGKGEPGEPEKYRPTGKINYVRVVPADDVQGQVGADWSKKLGAKKVFVIHDNEGYGKMIAELYRDRAKEIGLTVVGFEGIDWNNQQTFKPLMVKVKAQAPDLIYFGGTTQTKADQIAKDIVDSGMNVKYMVPDGCYEEAFIKSAGPEFLNERTYITFGGFPPETLKGKGAAFVAGYEKKHGAKPDLYSVCGYEAAMVALEAIRKAGKKDRDSIREACLKIKDFDGALGKWSFDSNGDTTLRRMSGHIVREGNFEFVEVLGE